MFPDLARDDVFRLETERLWLRWPRASDAAAIAGYCRLWEVARYTARIPHPYPEGSAERFIFAAREANATGRDLTLVVTPMRGKREVVGAISLETRGLDRLTLGFALSPEVWGKEYATEATVAMLAAGFGLTKAVEIFAAAFVENVGSQRVLEKCGFEATGTGLEGAPARGGMVESRRYRLKRETWIARPRGAMGAELAAALTLEGSG